jgi:NTE family protein
MIPPLRVALSGGAILGVAHIGALEVLQERGKLKCVKEYLGISAGAIVAFCLCIGYTLSELRALITVFNFTKIQNLEPEIMFSFVESYGFDDGANIDKLFTVLLRAKGLSPEITFREFSEKFPNHPSLRIFATEVSTRSLKEFSLKKTPDIRLKFAIRASVSIPIIFTPVEDLSGSYFVDGGIISNFPFHLLTDEERERAIGITFYRYTIQEGPVKINNIFEYIQRVCSSAYYHQEERLYKKWSPQIIAIKTAQNFSLNFEATSEEKEALMEAGRASAEEFLRAPVPRVARRYSSP